MIGVQLGVDVHVLDRATSGPKPALVKQLGGTYHTGAITDIGLRPHIVVECTGVTELIVQALRTVAAGGIICLTGIGSATAPASAPAAALANDVVLKNIALFGSVNANRRHYYRAATALAAADPSWLDTAGDPTCTARSIPASAAASTGRHQGHRGVRAALSRPRRPQDSRRGPLRIYVAASGKHTESAGACLWGSRTRL